MKKVVFFDTKPYDKESFERQNNGRYDIRMPSRNMRPRCCCRSTATSTRRQRGRATSTSRWQVSPASTFTARRQA